MPVKRKALRLKQALKSATRRNSNNGALLPLPNEQPLVTLRLEIISCSDLLAKDRNGFSDPFVVASILKQKHQTPVVKKSVEPVFNTVFDFPLYLSLSDQLAMIELIVWDKDMLRKDYLGEASLPLESWFTANPTYRFDQAPVVTLNLDSTREGTKAQGKISIRLGFIDEGKDFKRAFELLLRESRPSIVSAPPTEGVGTTHDDDGRVDDDGGISSDEEEQQLTTDESESEDEAEDTPVAAPSGTGTPLYTIYSPPDQNQHPHTPIPAMPSPQTPRSRLPLTPRFKRSLSGSSPIVSPLTPTPVSTEPSVSAEPTSANKKKVFRKSWSSSPSTPTLPVTPTTPGRPKRSASLSRIARRRRTREPYSLQQNTSITGILLLTISRASSLPRLPSFHRLTFDMDPFVVVSFSTKIFRTRVIRHSLNPVWEEKLGIHVRKWETGRGLNVRFKVVDWDKFSGNDFVGEGYLDIDSLIAAAPAPDPQTGLFDLVKLGEEGGLAGEGKEYVIPLSHPGKVMDGGATLTIRAKYTPYSLLRQQFWSRLLHSYDLDDTLSLSHIELSSMLDSLGSTLSRSTVESFWSRFGKDHKTDELTFGQVISCLEDEIGKESSEKPHIHSDNGDNGMETPSGAMTPLFSVKDAKGRNMSLEDVRFDFGPSVTEGLDGYFSREYKESSSASSSPGATSSGAEDVSEPEEIPTTPPPQVPPISVDSVDVTPKSKEKRTKFRRKPKPTLPLSPLPGAELVQERERIINIATCPLCNRPRMNSKAEVDIITHLAVCSSNSNTTTSSEGSAGLSRLVAGEFVTASQAQRKWLSKFLSKMSTGSYALGANSANIIVQDRRTGQLEEERMQVYVRLGIRLLYKGATSRMESSRARNMLKSLSIKQGLKFDHPDSVRDISTFITFYNLNMDEVLKPLQDFTSFNDFFYRKLKPDARPVEGSGDHRMVSAADCRFMAFESVSLATNIWIKGRSFSVQKLLGSATWADLKEATKQAFEGGPLCIFRLAPQDYHRFHSPVRGTIGKIRSIEGEYYTVNPQAIRTTIDVYGENVRTIVPIHSLEFGTVIAVCVGAMMVGSTVITVKEGQEVQRGEEFGYFAFGGSTIVMLFEKGRVVWDEDLQVNGRASLETLVRVGMGIGNGKTLRNGQA